MKTATALLQAFVAAIALWPTDGSAQTLSLTIEKGLVTLDARDVSLRQILQRWSDVGEVTVLNVDAVPPTPLTLQLSGVTERAALDTLLRSMSGYVLGPRQPGRTGAEIARIMILPASAGVRTSGGATQLPFTQPSVATAEFLLESAPAAVATIRQSEPNEETDPATLFDAGSPAGTLGVGAAAAGAANRPPAPEPPARPPDQPIRFLEEVDPEGNRGRAPSVPLDQPAAESAQGVAPKGPFGTTTGTATPGTIVPAPKQP